MSAERTTEFRQELGAPLAAEVMTAARFCPFLHAAVYVATAPLREQTTVQIFARTALALSEARRRALEAEVSRLMSSVEARRIVGSPDTTESGKVAAVVREAIAHLNLDDVSRALVVENVSASVVYALKDGRI